MAETLTKKIFKSFKGKCRGTDVKGNPVLKKEDAELIFINIYSDGTPEVFCRYRENKFGCNALSKEQDLRYNGLCPYMRGNIKFS